MSNNNENTVTPNEVSADTAVESAGLNETSVDSVAKAAELIDDTFSRSTDDVDVYRARHLNSQVTRGFVYAIISVVTSPLGFINLSMKGVLYYYLSISMISFVFGLAAVRSARRLGRVEPELAPRLKKNIIIGIVGMLASIGCLMPGLVKYIASFF